MHTIYLRIQEELGERGMKALQSSLSRMDAISDVEVHRRTPQDMLVEFEEQTISPIGILRHLGRQGVHADIMSG